MNQASEWVQSDYNVITEIRGPRLDAGDPDYVFAPRRVTDERDEVPDNTVHFEAGQKHDLHGHKQFWDVFNREWDETLASGFTCTYTAAHLALVMGAETVVMVGQDLCYYRDRHHAFDGDGSALPDDDLPMVLKDQDGNKWKSARRFYKMKRAFEQAVSGFFKQEYDANFIQTGAVTMANFSAPGIGHEGWQRWLHSQE